LPLTAKVPKRGGWPIVTGDRPSRAQRHEAATISEIPIPRPSDLTAGGDNARYDGRFAARAAGIVSSAMRDLMSLSERPEIISLAGGFPNTESFPREVFDDVMSRMGREYLASSLQYGPTEGLGELREQIVEVMAHEGASARPSDLIVTTGGQQGIDLAVRTFIDPGDVVLAEGPTYPGAVPCFTTYQADVRHVPVDEHGLSTDLLEQTLQRLASEGRSPKLLYTIPNFHNPAGVTMSLERRRRVVELAREHDLMIVEDNPYGQVRFEGEALPTLWELDEGAGWVIYISTFSKILAPGLRLGWVAAPAPVLRKMNLGKQAADLNSSTVTQRFVLEYLRAYDWREHVGRLNAIYRSRRDAMVGALERELPGEARWSTPSGGLFVWAVLPDYIDTSDLLVEATTRHQVAFVPGSAAYLDGQGTNCMRLNFSGSSEETIAEGVRRIGAAVGDMTELYRAFRVDR
jgi:2-aminoadipate transaminase